MFHRYTTDWPARASCQILIENISVIRLLSDAIARRTSTRLKCRPDAPIRHQDQALTDQRRKNPTASGAHRPSVAPHAAPTPGFFRLRLKRSPFSQSGSAVDRERSHDRQRCHHHQLRVQQATLREAGEQ